MALQPVRKMCKKKLFHKKLVLIVINKFKRFYNEGNLSNKNIKPRQSFEKSVFVDIYIYIFFFVTIQHK